MVGYEPVIVTTLRRLVRHRAPVSLLMRVAGGPRDWRLLNERWALDGRMLATPVLGEPMRSMSTDERRIALLQIADECAEAGAQCPAPKDLAQYCGVSVSRIVDDLRTLRREGRLSERFAAEAHS